MKFSCTQENLNQCLVVVSHIANKNTNLPILNNVLIEAKETGIKLLATNLEIGIECILRGKTEKEGKFTVPAKIFADYVNLLPKDTINIELKSSDLKIKSNTLKTKIKGIESSEFPLIPKVEKKDPLVISASDFINAISKVIFSVAANETRPEISGVFMKIEEDNVTLAATDSYRLAEKKIKLKQKKQNILKEEIIIPARTLQEVLRILNSFQKTLDMVPEVAAKEDEILEIFISDNQILFVFSGIEIVSRIIEGNYPDYKQIIPDGHKTRVIANNRDLITAIKTTSLFTKSGVYNINLDFKGSSSSKIGEIIISSANSQVGENVSKVQSNFEGENNSIVLNFRYLLDVLQNILSEEIILEITNSDIPCVLRKPGDDSYVYIIMPIKS